MKVLVLNGKDHEESGPPAHMVMDSKGNELLIAQTLPSRLQRVGSSLGQGVQGKLQ